MTSWSSMLGFQSFGLVMDGTGSNDGDGDGDGDNATKTRHEELNFTSNNTKEQCVGRRALTLTIASRWSRQFNSKSVAVTFFDGVNLLQ
ncbi:hypothetical protein ACHAXS_012286 [Conticribra weissflogii]